MKYLILNLFFVSFLFQTACNNDNQGTTALPRSKPESEDVSSRSIINFLDAVESGDQELHSFMVLRHGKVVAEGWWDPYKAELKHTLYSTSKSFTSTAIGFAVTEGLLSVDDKVISFFPGSLPDTVSENLAAMSIKNLLTMSAGMDPEPRFNLTENWVKTFLSTPVINPPGSEFLYNSAATYMLSAIISKVTGETVLEYLTPRLFEPLNINHIDWEIDPDGINTGGWGLRLKTEDMAKFGQLYLNKGNWNGDQIIPASWIKEATTKKIDQAPELSEEEKANSDWLQGYCYKFWRSRYNSYRADGAFGQLIMVFPEKDAVVAVTAEARNMQKEVNLVFDNLLPGFSDEELVADEESYNELLSRLDKLKLDPPPPGENSTIEKMISGSTYAFTSAHKVESFSFSFEDGVCKVNNISVNGDEYQLRFGAGQWELFETMRPVSNLAPQSKENFLFLLPAKVAGAYSWLDNNNLELTLRYIESPHSMYFTFDFGGNEPVLKLHDSLRRQQNEHTLTGEKIQ